MPKIRQPRFTEAISAVATVAGGVSALARRIGVPRQQIEQWCDGRAPLSIKYVRLIATEFNQPDWVHILRPDYFGEFVDKSIRITPPPVESLAHGE